MIHEYDRFIIPEKYLKMPIEKLREEKEKLLKEFKEKQETEKDNAYKKKSCYKFKF